VKWNKSYQAQRKFRKGYKAPEYPQYVRGEKVYLWLLSIPYNIDYPAKTKIIPKFFIGES